MSGLEIWSIAAGVIQIAGLGAKLSVKLFTFSRKFETANRSIGAISKDIAAIGVLLHQVGTELNKDENARLCSSDAITTARELVIDCQQLFQDVGKAVAAKDPGQMKTNEAFQNLSEQRNLILYLIEDAKDSHKKFNRSQKCVQWRESDPVNEPVVVQIHSLSAATALDNPKLP